MWMLIKYLIKNYVQPHYWYYIFLYYSVGLTTWLLAYFLIKPDLTLDHNQKTPLRNICVSSLSNKPLPKYLNAWFFQVAYHNSNIVRFKSPIQMAVQSGDNYYKHPTLPSNAAICLSYRDSSKQLLKCAKYMINFKNCWAKWRKMNN